MRPKTFYLIVRILIMSVVAAPLLASATNDSYQASLVQAVIDKWQYTSETTSSPHWVSAMQDWLGKLSSSDLNAALQLDNYDALKNLLTQSASSGSSGSSGLNAAQAVATGKHYYTLSPCRLVDTRIAIPPYAGPIPAAGTFSFSAKNAIEIPRQGGQSGGCSVPAAATALVLNITSAGTTENGHLRAYPYLGTLPTASILNFTAGVNLANSTILPICTGTCGLDFNIFAYKPSHVIIDALGYFAD